MPPIPLIEAIYAHAGDANLVELYADEDWIEASVAGFGMLTHPEFEFVLVRGAAVADDVYLGVEGFFTGMREWLSGWSEYRIEVENMIEHEDAVAVLTLEHGRSRAGAVPVSQRGAVIYHFQDDLIRRCETYLDRGEVTGLGPRATAGPTIRASRSGREGSPNLYPGTSLGPGGPNR